MTDRAMLIMTTVGGDALADTLCEALLERRLAACIQTLPVTSRYRWQGEVQRDREILLLVKTSARAADAAMALIESRHDYDTPEIVALPITGGLPAYLSWLGTETRPTG